MEVICLLEKKLWICWTFCGAERGQLKPWQLQSGTSFFTGQERPALPGPRGDFSIWHYKMWILYREESLESDKLYFGVTIFEIMNTKWMSNGELLSYNICKWAESWRGRQGYFNPYFMLSASTFRSLSERNIFCWLLSVLEIYLWKCSAFWPWSIQPATTVRLGFSPHLYLHFPQCKQFLFLGFKISVSFSFALNKLSACHCYGLSLLGHLFCR